MHENDSQIRVKKGLIFLNQKSQPTNISQTEIPVIPCLTDSCKSLLSPDKQGAIL